MKLIIIALLLVNCAPTHTTKNELLPFELVLHPSQQWYESVKYPIKDFPTKEIVKVIRYTIDKLDLGEPVDIEKWRFMLIDHYMVRPNEQGDAIFADGMTIPEWHLVVVFPHQDCLADSSLVHEVLHTLGYKHDDHLAEHLMSQIQEQAIKDLCPPDYKSKPFPPFKLPGKKQ